MVFLTPQLCFFPRLQCNFFQLKIQLFTTTFHHDTIDLQNNGGNNMSEILICKSCKSTWGGDRETTVDCPDCNNSLLPLQISTDVWRSYSQEQKDSIKDKFLDDLKKSEDSLSPYHIMESYMRNMDKNIQTIKSILVFFTVLWGIFILIAIFSLG